MQTSPALWIALAIVTVGFAGCTGGQLDILVTPADDPVTEPFRFQATGPKYDHYEWDFSDGSPKAEGRDVEHVFGFTNGDIVVRLTAHNEGDEASQLAIARTVDLGGTRNVKPVGIMTANTYWVDPGEMFTVSSIGTTDVDGDPLLFRWTCLRVSDLEPLGGDIHEDLGGVPFGVDAWSGLDPDLTAQGTDLGTDACGAIDSTENRPWSLEDDAIQGSIGEPGRYVIELFVRDPKGTPWVGRLNLYVSDPERPKPAETTTISVDGTFQGGADGKFDAVYYGNGAAPLEELLPVPGPSEVACQADSDTCEQTFDRIRYLFTSEIPSLEGTITFSFDGPTADAGLAQYQFFNADEGTALFDAPKSEDHGFGKDTFRVKSNGSPWDYILEITMTQGAQMTVDFDMVIVNDLDPQNWYEPPPL